MPDEVLADAAGPGKLSDGDTQALADYTDTGSCSIFPKWIMRFPRSWVEQCFTDLRYWNELERGGHFPRWSSGASSWRKCGPSFD